MQKAKIAPSMMCADFLNLRSDLDSLKNAEVEYLHIDVMDGVFVPNIMLCGEIMKKMRKYSDIPFDLHLMITNPEYKIGWFGVREGDVVSIHYESTAHVQRALQEIKRLGATPSVALNPATPIDCLEYLLDDVGMVLLMTVNPGFAGQMLIPQMLDKIKKTRKFLNERGFSHVMIEVDGNVSIENAKKMREAGADVFVGGTSSIFVKDAPIERGVESLRRAIS